MNFAPAPANAFLQFMQTYYKRCKERVPQITAVAAKWAFEDLIPGLSDFDTRFIVDDSMTVDDWQAMSLAVGQVHADLCRERPDWARNLEHLPGINLTLAEVTNPHLFYPEFSQWTFYDGDRATLDVIAQYLADVPWSGRDELHHLKKFSIFFGPYQRGIDPPVNVEPWESKYPLHSRFMHYFAPPIQSAVSLVRKENVRGKLDAISMARELFPNPSTIDRVLEGVDRHYEIAEWYAEPQLTNLERELERYLHDVWIALTPYLTLARPESTDDVPRVRQKITAIPADPVHAFYESAKFGRLLKGRLRFYAESIPHFDTTWLIHIELGRILANFYTKPLTIYGKVRYKESLTPEQVLDRATGELLTPTQRDAMLCFGRIAAEPIPPGHEKAQASRVGEVFDIVPVVMDRLGSNLLQTV